MVVGCLKKKKMNLFLIQINNQIISNKTSYIFNNNQNGEYNSNHFIVSLEQRELEQELSKKKEKEVQDGTVL